MAGKIIADFMFGVGQVITGLVNDLITGGTDKALSSEQGKVLNDKMFGVGQTWQNMTASRALGVVYTNSTGRVIEVITAFRSSSAGTPNLTLDGLPYIFAGTSHTAANLGTAISFTVPPGGTYKLAYSAGTLEAWFEMR